jgi:hypothetical protein
MAEAEQYDVALSFAGEDRKQAEALAKFLREAGVNVFYDEYERASLWGADLFQHLADVYGARSQYCVVFVSENYLAKNWTKHELRQAQAHSFQLDREYILPLRLDDAVLPGLPATIGYVDLRQSDIRVVGMMLLRKLGKPVDEIDEQEAARITWAGDLITYNGRPMASFWPKQIERAQHRPAYLVSSVIDRIPWGDEKSPGERKKQPRSACHDCAVLPGQFHVPGCDIEQCPACGGQNISCGCAHEPLTRAAMEFWDEEGELPSEA